MDEYGCFRNNSDDWDTLTKHLQSSATVTFPYCADNLTGFVITITGPITQSGTMSWGGQTYGLFAVGLRRTGFEYFNLIGPSPIQIYDMDKLVHNASDAAVITELLEQLRVRLMSKYE